MLVDGQRNHFDCIGAQSSGIQHLVQHQRAGRSVFYADTLACDFGERAHARFAQYCVGTGRPVENENHAEIDAPVDQNQCLVEGEGGRIDLSRFERLHRLRGGLGVDQTDELCIKPALALREKHQLVTRPNMRSDQHRLSPLTAGCQHDRRGQRADHFQRTPPWLAGVGMVHRGA